MESIYLTSNPVREQLGSRAAVAGASTAATIINGMRPQIIGRALGIGIRVAGRMVSQRLASQAAAPARSPSAAAAPVQGRALAETVRLAGKAASTGTGGFFRSLRRVSGILWLEITGSFFLLFALVFAARLWQSWASFAHNPLSRNMVIGAAAVFFYLGVSSFWRARRR